MKSIGEFFYLVFLFFVVKWHQFREEKQVRKRFYKHLYFRICDQALKKEYRFQNPYLISKEFLKKRGEKEIHAYGETPLSVFDRIAELCDLSSQDTFVELGSGRGRGLFFLSSIYACKSIGLEWIPEFNQKAQKIAALVPQCSLSFSSEDMRQADFSQASVVYLYGTCLDDDSLYALIRSLDTLSKGSKVVTVSYPLTDYAPNSFLVKNSFEAIFPWGKTDVFIQEKR